MKRTSSSKETQRAQQVIVALLRTADATRHYLGRVVEAHGLTLQQYNVLRILRGTAPEPLPTMEIVERMLERTPGVTRFLDHLEERGLVRRQRCTSDRRMVHAWITDEGLALLGGMDAEIDRADAQLVEGLGTKSAERLVAALDVVRDNAR